ncbi:MAG: amidohydrolase family protein [Clostridia bacterium]|nr:amidohydrolase family protein [Clostridia bacterium]
MTYNNLKIFDTTSMNTVTGMLSVKDGVLSDTSDTVSDEYAGLYALPGYVDVHTHGVQGDSFETGDVDINIKMLKYYASAGTLYLMPTIGTIEFDAICKAADAIIEAAQRIDDEKLDAATVIGIHYECRYLSPARAGAHAPHLLTAPNTSEADLLINKVEEASVILGRRLHAHFTIAPELEGGIEFIKYATSRGATVSIGHSDADAAQAQEAIDAGANAFTHTFNAFRPINHRMSAALTTALTGDAYTELICDGKHILPETVRLMRHCKDDTRMVIITDSVAGGLKEGDKFTFLGGKPSHVEGGLAMYDDGTICGSIMTMSRCAKNFKEFTDASAEEIFTDAISNPLRMVDADEYARMKTGDSASFILVDGDLNLRHVFVNGNMINSFTEA